MQVFFRSVLLISLITALISCSGGDKNNTSVSDSEPEKVFQEFWDIYDRHYPLMHRKNIDWKTVYSTYSAKISATTSDEQLLEIFSTIMSTIIKDGHSFIAFNNADEIGFEPEVNENTRAMIETNTASKVALINQSSGNPYISYGTLIANENIGYIVSKQFEPVTNHEEREFNAFKTIVNEALSALQNKSGIIIDLRTNGGGQAHFAYYLAGRFMLESPVDVLRGRYKISTGSTDSSLSNWVLETADNFEGYPDSRAEGGTVASTFSNSNSIDASGPFQFSNKVVLLTSRQTASAAEQFTVAIKSQPQVKSIGNTTFGIFSGSEMFTLTEGGGKWKTNVSVHDSEVSYGGVFQSFEGVGIEPDEKLIPTVSEVDSGRDIHLEAAMEYIGP